jgi:hypothetical protein
MNNKVCLITIISVLVLLLGIYLYKNNRENFSTVNVHPDRRFGLLLREQLNNNAPENTATQPDPNGDDHTHSVDLSKYIQKSQIIPNPPKLDMSQYIKKTDVEMAAEQISKQYCPVDRNFDINDYVKKSEIPPPNANCPEVPDLRDFVLKSTVPPAQKCPACICPKVKVSAGMCKKCPPADTTKCPPPKACDARQCKDIIKCPDGKRGCPKPSPCPPPERCNPCPVKVCPSVKIPPPEKIKCPPTAPCPVPPPCPPVQRCPEKKEKCEYKGIKEVEVIKEIYKNRPIPESIKALIENGGTNSQKELKKIANMLETMSPSSIESLGKLNKSNQNLQSRIDELIKQNENLSNQSEDNSTNNSNILSNYEGNEISDGIVRMAAEKARVEGRVEEIRTAVANNDFEFLVNYLNSNNNNSQNTNNNVGNNNVRNNNVRNNNARNNNVRNNNVRNNNVGNNNVGNNNVNNSTLNRINRGLLKLIGNNDKERTYQLTQLVNRNVEAEENAINNLGGENNINNIAENINNNNNNNINNNANNTNNNLNQNELINNLLNQPMEENEVNNLLNNINNINMANNDLNINNTNRINNVNRNIVNPNFLSEEENIPYLVNAEMESSPAFINQILEEESIRRQLGENDVVTPQELNRIRQLAPKTLKQCEPVKPIHRYNNYGLLGSIFN